MNSLAALLIAKAVRARIEQGDCPTDKQQPRETVEEALCELQRMIAADLVSQEYTALLREVEGLRKALRKYGNHTGCDKNKQMPIEQGRIYMAPTDFDAWRDSQACTCGFEAALSPASGGV